MGLADWVFPGFLFMVGMAIPYSIGKRISQKQETNKIARHIIIRTISLLIIGVLMLNSGRVNPELTGIGKNLWAILMYTGVFLFWNNYKENDKNFFTITGLRLTGIAMLVFLVFKFKSGEIENNGSLITGWWGILGLIGWGYLVSAFVYLASPRQYSEYGCSISVFPCNEYSGKARSALLSESCKTCSWCNNRR